MVTITQLRTQIARERTRKKKIKTQLDLEIEKSNLQLELKKLQRKPSTLRNIKFAKRTGRGLKILGKKTFKVIKKQAILIKDQQLRDQALARKQSLPKTKLVKRIEITGKGKKKKRKVIFERVKVTKKKVRKIAQQQSDFFGGLQGLDF